MWISFGNRRKMAYLWRYLNVYKFCGYVDKFILWGCGVGIWLILLGFFDRKYELSSGRFCSQYKEKPALGYIKIPEG